MALTDPGYAQITTLAGYVNQLAYLKQQYNPGNKDYINAQAAKLRWQAVLGGIDLTVLERETLIKIGQNPDTYDWAAFEKNTNMPFTYAVTLGNIKKTASSNPTSAHEEAQKLRLTASSAGIDLSLLEQRALQYASPSHTEPSAATLSVAANDIKEAQYAAALLKNAMEYKAVSENDSLTAAQKKARQDALHQSSQNIRSDALSDGLSLWDIEKLFTPYVTGHPWNNADYAAAKSYIDTLYTAAGKNPATVSVPTRSTTTSGTNFTYKQPVVKRTMFGETYSGADMVVHFAFPGYRPVEVGVCSTLSVTTYREKKQFRTLGRTSARGITKGPRTVSGKLIFTIIKENIVELLRDEIPYLKPYTKLKFDELPSFDVLITMANEYGGAATMVINGVTTVDEQLTLSIEELFTENIFTYLARDYQPLRATNKSLYEEYDPQEWYSYKLREAGSELIGKFTIDDLLLNDNTAAYIKSLPTVSSGEGWTNLTAADMVASYYGSLPNEETAAATAAQAAAAAVVRKIFIQVFNKTTNKPVSNGDLSITFSGDTYDPESTGTSGTLYSYDGQQEYDWSLAKASDDGKYYGLFVIPDNLSAGAKYSISYTGHKKTGIKSATISGTVSSGESTYVKIVTAVSTDLQPMLYKVDGTGTPMTTYYESERKIDKMPSLSELSGQGLYQVQKSVDGKLWASLEVYKGNSRAAGVTVYYTWEMFIDHTLNYVVADPAERAKLNQIDTAALKSLPATKYWANESFFSMVTAGDGNISLNVAALYWKGKNNKKLKFEDLPAGTVVKVYAKVKDGSSYIQWMLRKVSNANSL